MLLLALGGVGAVAPTGAVTPGGENPYTVITNRNAFGIRPPPDPEVLPPPAPPAPPPNVFLTGVSHQNGVKKAFFVINRPGSKVPDYETAVEGDELQDLKVTEINAKEGKVRVLVSGREVVLNFADNGLKANTGPAVPNVPGRPGSGTVPQPVAPVPTAPGGGGSPVVIGRGGVNLGVPGSSTALGSGAAATVGYPGAFGEPAGMTQPPITQPLTRTLPHRAGASYGTAPDVLQAQVPIQASGAADHSAREPIPLPPGRP
jgi:hypothetical protein